jgi:hypothetical protein
MIQPRHHSLAAVVLHLQLASRAIQSERQLLIDSKSLEARNCLWQREKVVLFLFETPPQKKKAGGFPPASSFNCVNWRARTGKQLPRIHGRCSVGC